MIKINLATRKQSGLAIDGKAGGGSGGGLNISSLFGGVELGGVKDLNIRKVLVPIALSFVASYMLDVYKEDEMNKLQAEQEKLSSEAQRLQVELDKLKGYESIKKTLEEDEVTIKTKIEAIQKILASRSDVQKTLVNISSSIPSDVWMNEFRVDKQHLEIKGEALGYTQISDFMKALNENASLGDVELKNTQQGKETAANGSLIMTFEIGANRR